MAGTTNDKRSAMMTTVIIVLLLSLMGAGAGLSVGFLLQPGKEPSKPAPDVASQPKPEMETAEREKLPGQSSDEDADSESSEEDELPDADVKVIAIPPVVTTLASPEGKWIRLEGSILAAPGGDKSPELMAEGAGEQILAYLRTVRLDQLQGPSGFLALRDDLNETVRSMSKGQVRGVLIHGLLIE